MNVFSVTTQLAPDYGNTAELLEAQQLFEEDYEQLLHRAEVMASHLAVPDSLQQESFHLLATLREHDEKTAKECLQALPLALVVAEVYGDFYCVPVNLGHVWMAALLHDIGKTVVRKSLIDKSNLGLEWTELDRLEMKEHVFAGCRIALAHNLPMPVCRAIAEHHHRQLGVSYGLDPQLNDVERIIRDSVAIADFTDADLNRTNTRNIDKDRAARLQEIHDDIDYVFNDYSEGSTLAHLTFQRLTTS